MVIKSISRLLGRYLAGFALDACAHNTTQAKRQAAEPPTASRYGSRFGSRKREENKIKQKVKKVTVSHRKR